MSERNATASWSGYSHQGQVGILVAIREMKRLFENNLSNEFTQHFLVYESYEDVGLYKLNANNDKEFLSVHQVKAIYSDGQRFNTYSEVFTGKPIYEKGLDGKYIKNNGNKVPTNTFVEGDWCQNLNCLHTVVNVNNWPAVNPTAFGNPPKIIQRYNYGNDTYFCATNAISTKISEELISHYFLNANTGLINLALPRLTFMLDEKIRTEHATKGGKDKYNICFSFQELNNIIQDINDVRLNEIYLSRKYFFEKYIEVACNEAYNFDEIHIENIYNSIIQKLYVLSDIDFLNFLQKLNPHLSPELLQTSHHNFNSEGLKQVFFNVILHVNNVLPDINDNYIQYSNVGKTLLLTTINNDVEEGKIVVESIFNNLISQNIYWEGYKLINRNINGKLVDLNPKINAILDNQEMDNENKKFMSFTSQTELIDRNNAKTDLNNENVN